MKTLTAANQKGGVGKTASIINFAYYLALKEKKKVIVVDLDTQANASYTLLTHKAKSLQSSALFSNKPPAIPKLTEHNITLIAGDPELANIDSTMKIENAVKNFKSSLEVIKKAGYDYCLIDTPPQLSIRLSTALATANYVFSPVELEIYSIQGIQLMQRTIERIKATINPDLNFIGLLPSRVDTRNPRHKTHLEELKKLYKVIPHMITVRVSVAEALTIRCPIWEIKKTSARPAIEEITKLSKYLIKYMR